MENLLVNIDIWVVLSRYEKRKEKRQTSIMKDKKTRIFIKICLVDLGLLHIYEETITMKL